MLMSRWMRYRGAEYERRKKRAEGNKQEVKLGKSVKVTNEVKTYKGHG
jgi:hypothetical protein